MQYVAGRTLKPSGATVGGSLEETAQQVRFILHIFRVNALMHIFSFLHVIKNFLKYNKKN